ncbi:MAG: formyltransferase family protein [Gammaproteobacteria bacterium]
MKLVIFVMGEKGFSLLRALFELDCTEIVECVVGRDKNILDDQSKSIKSFCEKNNINFTWYGAENCAMDGIDLYIAAGWRWMIRDIPRDQLIVLHDSLLPKYRGFLPLVSALLNRESVTGVTALLGSDKYDNGNILMQHSMEVSYPTSIGNEIYRISQLYASLIRDLILKLNSGEISRNGYPQDEDSATYSLWRDEEDYHINWSDSSDNIAHFINCVGRPYLGALAMMSEDVIRVFKAISINDVKIENRTPGKVIFMQDGFPVVVCGLGLLKILEAQKENGHSIFPLRSFRTRFS